MRFVESLLTRPSSVLLMPYTSTLAPRGPCPSTARVSVANQLVRRPCARRIPWRTTGRWRWSRGISVHRVPAQAGYRQDCRPLSGDELRQSPLVSSALANFAQKPKRSHGCLLVPYEVRAILKRITSLSAAMVRKEGGDTGTSKAQAIHDGGSLSPEELGNVSSERQIRSDFPWKNSCPSPAPRARCGARQDLRCATRLCRQLEEALAQKFLCDRRAARTVLRGSAQRIRNGSLASGELSVGELRGERGSVGAASTRGPQFSQVHGGGGSSQDSQRVSVKDRLGLGLSRQAVKVSVGGSCSEGRLAPRGERTPVGVGRDRGRGGEGGFLAPTGRSIIPIKVLVQLRKRKRAQGPVCQWAKAHDKHQERLFC
ncbi:hypothetical protein Q5P01_000432 [Channa striata]|uniref:Uncharacterized protein n=1 Tax=Channa striata TaxID=64152 RepID=A0AA88LF60_CHASR|nr:hypothetical protein Q5P01_000432 [Channa striata]